MSNFTSKEDAVSFIKEICLNNLHDWQFSQKLLEIEEIIADWYEYDGINDCSECGYEGNQYDEEDMEDKHEEGYEEGMKDTLEAVLDYVKRRLKHE